MNKYHTPSLQSWPPRCQEVSKLTMVIILRAKQFKNSLSVVKVCIVSSAWKVQEKRKTYPKMWCAHEEHWKWWVIMVENKQSKCYSVWGWLRYHPSPLKSNLFKYFRGEVWCWDFLNGYYEPEQLLATLSKWKRVQ